MSGSEAYLLWENENFTIHTPSNPHISYSEGAHLFVAPKQAIPTAWANPELASKTFNIASQACAVMEDLQLAPWFNLQANGNLGLLSGGTLYFHIHIYGRNKTVSWGKPLVLPEAPNTYHNDPMPQADRERLSRAFSGRL